MGLLGSWEIRHLLSRVIYTEKPCGVDGSVTSDPPQCLQSERRVTAPPQSARVTSVGCQADFLLSHVFFSVGRKYAEQIPKRKAGVGWGGIQNKTDSSFTLRMLLLTILKTAACLDQVQKECCVIDRQKQNNIVVKTCRRWSQTSGILISSTI